MNIKITFLFLVTIVNLWSGYIEESLKSKIASLSNSELIRVIIVLNKQINSFPEITGVGDKKAIREIFVSQLKELTASQSELLSYLNNNRASNITSLWIINAISCVVQKPIIYEIASRVDVNWIAEDEVLKPIAFSQNAPADILKGVTCLEGWGQIFTFYIDKQS